MWGISGGLGKVGESVIKDGRNKERPDVQEFLTICYFLQLFVLLINLKKQSNETYCR